MNNYIGDLSFGAENATPEDLSVRWFDYWLKGIDNGVMKEPPVKLYVMLPPDQGSIGGGFWVTGDSYPLPGTKTVRYYLGGKNANTFLGDGVLSLNPSAASGSDCYKYDPANPVPTVGGAWSAGKLLLRGAYDQRPIEMRPDVLVYTSEALTDPVSVVGNISVTLTASSSAPSTAFTAKLVDVHLDGYAQILSNGIIVTPSAAPDTVATYTIQMNPTATIFKPGHRIRLEISSSNYPPVQCTYQHQCSPRDRKEHRRRHTNHHVERDFAQPAGRAHLHPGDGRSIRWCRCSGRPSVPRAAFHQSRYFVRPSKRSPRRHVNGKWPVRQGRVGH